VENQHILEEVIRENLRKIDSYIKTNKIEAFRVYNMDHPGYPLSIDLYKDNAVIHVYEEIYPETIPEVEAALKGALGIENCFWKSKAKKEIQLPKLGKKEVVVEEYGCKFLINLSDYLDTGLFLDHRETRKWIQSLSRGKIVANTFAYTGSFSIHAAIGGAARTYSVDLSKTYGQWTKKNIELNGLSTKDHWVINMDTFEFFKYALKKGLLFDIIIIDPPTFSRNKGSHFHVQKDHVALIEDALKVLAPGGFIVFSNNFQEFEIDDVTLASCKIEQKNDTIAPDFQELSPHHCFIITK
jgi:23S rRNA (cytosine1962-C5)-methyltransferase